MENIDVYYESLKEVFEQIRKWKPPNRPFANRLFGMLAGLTGVFLALSVIPILPAALVYLGWPVDDLFLSLNLTWGLFSRFLLVWPACVSLTSLLLVLFVWIQPADSNKTKEPPQALSPEQLAFVCAYEAFRELKVYFVSHIDQHVELSLVAFSRLVTPNSTLDAYDISEMIVHSQVLSERAHGDLREQNIHRLVAEEKSWYGKKLDAGLIDQVRAARNFLKTFEKFAWFQPDSRTKQILQALISLQEKIPQRLRLREDLPAVLTILENLSGFLYAYLPEHQTYMDAKELEKLQVSGSECLSRFVSAVNELTSYQLVGKMKSGIESSKPTLRKRFEAFYSYSIFFRFTVWFMLILVLTSAAVVFINQLVKLTADTMATVIIGTSVASAAVLASFLPKSSQSD
jgi:hypothetical protein